MDAPTLTPFFPLGLVCFPGERLNLHIFEPRYRQLIAECEETGMSFVIPPYESGGIHAYGTEVRLVEVFRRYPDGESDIAVLGIAPVRVASYVRTAPGKLYPGGETTRLDGVSDGDERSAEALREAYEAFCIAVGRERVCVPAPGAELSFALGHEVGLELSQKSALLAIVSEMERRAYLLDHLVRVTAFVEDVKKRPPRRNGNGYHG